MEVYGVEHRAKPEDDVGPALAARRPMVELPEPPAMRRFFGESVPDACGREAVEDAELALAQPLIDDRPRRPAGESALLADERRGLLCADIRRRKNDLRPVIARQRGEPAAGGLRLIDSEGRQRHVDVAQIDVDFVRAGLVGGVSRDIALALAMPHQPQPLRPILTHCRPPPTAQRISAAIVPLSSLDGPCRICDRYGSIASLAHWCRRGQHIQYSVRQLLPGGLRMFVASAARRRAS